MLSIQVVVQILCLERLFFVKIGVSENGWCTFFGGGEVLGDCYCMMLVDALEGCSKNPIKHFF